MCIRDSDNTVQLPRGVKNANAMRKARMGCPGIYKLGKSELLNSAKPLKLSRLYNLPTSRFEAITFELDQSMDRIQDSSKLWSHYLCRHPNNDFIGCTSWYKRAIPGDASRGETPRNNSPENFTSLRRGRLAPPIYSQLFSRLAARTLETPDVIGH